MLSTNSLRWPWKDRSVASGRAEMSMMTCVACFGTFRALSREARWTTEANASSADSMSPHPFRAAQIFLSLARHFLANSLNSGVGGLQKAIWRTLWDA